MIGELVFFGILALLIGVAIAATFGDQSIAIGEWILRRIRR